MAAHWNYRLMQHDDCVEVVEVHYRDGVPWAYSRAGLVADSAAEVPEVLEMMERACELPALHPSDFPVPSDAGGA